MVCGGCGSFTVRLNSPHRRLFFAAFRVWCRACCLCCVAGGDWDKKVLITVTNRLGTSHGLG